MSTPPLTSAHHPPWSQLASATPSSARAAQKAQKPQRRRLGGRLKASPRLRHDRQPNTSYVDVRCKADWPHAPSFDRSDHKGPGFAKKPQKARGRRGAFGLGRRTEAV